MIKCEVEDCSNLTYRHGYCIMHLRRWQRHGDPNILKKAPSGTGCIDSNGYVKVMVDSKSTYEHILLAENALGRRLTADEVVHHTGQRHENHGSFKLVVCTREYHALIHRRMKDLGCG